MRLAKGYSFDSEKQLYAYRFTVNKKRYAVYGRTQKECEDKKAEKLDSLKNHMHLDNQKITLDRYFGFWKEEQAKAVKASTIYSYEKTWGHIRKHLGSQKIVDIQKMDVQRFQKELSAAKSVETTNRALRLLKQILNSAMNDRIINFNPCNGVKYLKSSRPKAADTTHRALTEEETKLFLENAGRCHYFNLFRFLLATGCRVSEATALSWFDVNTGKKELYISKTVSRTSHNDFVVSDTPKTRSSNRTIPITDEVESILKEQWENNRMLYGSRCTLVFPNNQGNLANYNGIDNSIRIIIGNINSPDGKGKAGIMNRIQPFSVHAFRDTFATRCIEQGMQPNTLKAILGHSSLKMTMDLYAHVMPNTKQEELAKIRFVI